MNLPPKPVMRSDLGRALAAAGERAEDRIIDCLIAHLELLAAWNERFHLTALNDWPEILDRHLNESLLALRWIGRAGALVDLGSGNGFPAIPILVCRPQLEGTLVERSENKSVFLEEALSRAGVLGSKILTLDLGMRDAERLGRVFDVVTSRATMAPRQLLILAARLIRPRGRIFLYSNRADAEKAIHESGSPLTCLAQETIPGRKDSVLFVLEG